MKNAVEKWPNLEIVPVPSCDKWRILREMKLGPVYSYYIVEKCFDGFGNVCAFVEDFVYLYIILINSNIFWRFVSNRQILCGMGEFEATC